MKYDLEACPFCGRRDAKIKHSSNWGWFVSCQCHAVGPSAGSKDGAVSAWNNRREAEQGRLI